jgi:hypothetical protein
VYATQLEGVLHMSLCSRTTLSELAQEDFDALGKAAQTGLLAPGALTVGGTGGTSGAGGTSGTGLVPAGGCAIAGQPSIPAHAALAISLIVATALRSRRRKRS